MPERLWEKVERTAGCWIWKGARGPKGYGVIRLAGGGSLAVHRLSYELSYGQIPEARFICHRCDNPPCVRPDHLYAGSPADNTHDRDNRGRNGKARVTADQVRELRARRQAGEKLAALAAAYGLSISQTCSIAKGRDWKSV